MAITTSYRTRSDAVPLRSFPAKGRPSAIAGVGVYAPEKVLSNSFGFGGHNATLVIKKGESEA